MKTEKVTTMSLTLVLMLMAMLLTAVNSQASVGWNLANPMTIARYDHRTTLLQNGKVLVTGGEDSLADPLAIAELYDPGNNSWSAAGSMASARSLHSATLLPSGKVLVVGGWGPVSANALASAELYDPATNSWSAAGSLSAARYNHNATLLPSGKVLVVGGYNGGELSSAELYDPDTNSWSAAGSMGTARINHSVTLLPSGKVLVAGGINGSSYLASVELYDPATNSWSAAASLVTGREAHSASLLSTGKVLVAGGYNTGNGGFLGSAELYDPALNSWSPAGAMVTVQAFHSATLLPNGKVLVAGGESNGASLVFAGTQLYDPATNSWDAASSMVHARVSHSSTLLPSGKVLVVGGFDFINRLANVEFYDPATPGWSAADSLAAARSYHSVTLLPNGKVLVSGGYDGNTYLASSELYDYVTNSWSPAGSMATARRFHSATLLQNGKVLIVGGSSAELYDQATNSWSSAGSLATARYERHKATLLASGKVLVTGGTGDDGAIADNELYDPATNSWSAAGSMATARYNHTATLLPNGKVLVTGGTQNTWVNAFVSAELYDPATNSWSAAGSMANARYDHSATLLPDGKVLVAGGGYTVILNSAELYDPATNSWSTAGSLATRRMAHETILLPSGKVLAVSGYNGHVLASAEVYDPTTNSWSAAGSLGEGRTHPSMTLLPSGKVLVAAGYNNDTSSYYASAELFDPGDGFSDSRRPVISALANTNDNLSLTGTGFRGDSEATSGATNSSPTNYPLLQLRRLDNEQTSFIASSSSLSWNDISFTSQSLNPLLAGYYSATIFVNGIPSVSTILTVGATAGIDPASHDFGSIEENISSSHVFTISNSGNQNLTISSIVTVDGDSALFSIDPGDAANGTCGSLTPTIAAGGNCTISVTFKPTSPGTRSTILRVTSNDSAAPSMNIALTGTGPLPSYTISVVEGSGIISCDSPVVQGNAAVCIVGPTPPGYHFATFTDNGVDMLSSVVDGLYVINDVQTNHIIAGTFASGIPWPSATNINALAIDPINTQTLYAGTYDYGGVLKSTDGGTTWTAFNVGFASDTYRVLSLAIDPTNTQIVYAGTSDHGGVLESIDGGITWSAINDGLNPSPYSVLSLAINPANTQIVYAGTDGGVYKTSNGDASWTQVNSEHVNTLAINPMDSQIVYAGSISGRIFKSIDGGINWTTSYIGITPSECPPSPPGGSMTCWRYDPVPPDIFSLAQDPVDSRIVYAGTTLGIYKTTDGGTSWTTMNGGLTGGYVQSLAIDPTRNQTVYAGTPGGIFKTTNGGATWRAIHSGVTDIFSLAIDPINGQTVYAGTPDGVFKLTNSPGVPDAPIIGTATADDGQATVAFSLPADDGGSDITGYIVTSNPGNVSAIGTESPITVTGLINGTTYTFTVVATNAVGNSVTSAQSNSLTPMPPPTVDPGVAANVTISPATAQTVVRGTTATFTITPDAGYGVVVSGCGGSLSSTTYTTGPISSNCVLAIEAVKRSGSTSETTPSLVDALNVFRAVNSLTTLTPQQQVRYDVAPLGINGTPTGNGVLDLADVILILRRSIGIGNW